MAKYVVGTTALTITDASRARPLIQNLGPGVIYLDTDVVATTDSGIKLDVGQALQFATTSASETIISIISTQASTDVRVILMGEK